VTGYIEREFCASCLRAARRDPARIVDFIEEVRA